MTKDREQTRDQAMDDRLPGVFQPDTILPSQYFNRGRRRSQHEGERRLMFAILEDAVDVYRKQVGTLEGRNRPLFKDAESWIEDADRTWLFSFQNICDVLDIDADYIRRGLHALRARSDAARRVVVPVEEQPPLRRASGD